MEQMCAKMKVIIVQFGPIKSFRYDLDKDLIVTYGNNNIGKSYAMQLVYITLKNLISRNNRLSLFGRPHIGNKAQKQLFDHWEKFVKEFLASDKPNADVLHIVKEYLTNLLTATFLRGFLISCENTFGQFQHILTQESKIHLSTEKYSLHVEFAEPKITVEIKDTAQLVKTSTRLELRGEQRALVVEAEDTANFMNFTATELLQTYGDSIFREFIDQIKRDCAQVYFLPASRSGIYSGMNSFSAIVAELSKQRSLLTRKIELPGISEPIADYFLYLSNIDLQRNSESIAYKNHLELSRQMEQELLSGQVDFDEERKVLLYNPNNLNLSFTMPESSSMVSEIAPIIAFLKYIFARPMAQRKIVLFIEEPEAHLHPSKQILLMQYFVKLLALNIKVVLSSHSNYVFNKLNNMVLSGELDYQRYEPILLEATDGGKSVAKNLDINDLGAMDENFVDVSNELYEERQRILMDLESMDDDSTD